MRIQDALRQEIAERKEAQRKLYDSEDSLRQLSRHLLRTQDEERKRIGRDLHDSLGQSLVAMKINLDSLTMLAGQNTAAVERIAACIELVDSSIKEVRTISYLLHPPMLDEMGLKSAILWYLDGFSARSGIKTTFEVQADFARLSRDAELALFRVLQESLTNIHRHSGSPTADIRLLTQNGMAILEVKDRGKGVARRPLEPSNQEYISTHISTHGVGLRGMHERMLQLRGSFELTSSKEGTTVRAAVPTEDARSTTLRKSA